MTQESDKPVSAARVDRRKLIRQLRRDGSLEARELDLSLEELLELEADLNAADVKTNGQRENKRWVLLH